MKEKVEVAAIQMAPYWMEPKKNLEKMIILIEDTLKQRKVDLIVFPELVNVGYLRGRDWPRLSEYINKAEPIPGEITNALGRVAQENRIFIVVGLIQAHPTIPVTVYNSAVLINNRGEIVGVHQKMHIPSEEKHYFYPGNTCEVYKTEIGNIGMLVCYDCLFPELARILSLKGAEILCGLFAYHKASLPFVPRRLEYIASVRSSENRNFFISCNRSGQEDDLIFFGRSAIAGPGGEILSFTEDEGETVIYATLEKDLFIKSRAYSARFRDRRPDKYDIIVQLF